MRLTDSPILENKSDRESGLFTTSFELFFVNDFVIVNNIVLKLLYGDRPIGEVDR